MEREIQDPNEPWTLYCRWEQEAEPGELFIADSPVVVDFTDAHIERLDLGDTMEFIVAGDGRYWEAHEAPEAADPQGSA